MIKALTTSSVRAFCLRFEKNRLKNYNLTFDVLKEYLKKNAKGK